MAYQDWKHHEIQNFIVVETKKSGKNSSFEISATVKVATKLKVDKNGVAIELGPEISATAKWTVTRESEISKYEIFKEPIFP